MVDILTGEAEQSAYLDIETERRRSKPGDVEKFKGPKGPKSR